MSLTNDLQKELDAKLATVQGQDARILILDEATSALDYESESAIISRLPEISQGRTVISIAHRLSTLTHCDRVINLNDNGNMV